MIVFSCGHDNTSDPDFQGHSVVVAGYDRKNERCARHMNLCTTCMNKHALNNSILKDDDAIDDWLRGD